MNTPQFGLEGRSSSIRNLRWSAAEKKIARQAFDRALQREFAAVIGETKRMAADIQQPSQLWDLEDYLRNRRKEIDARFDYRYSVLLFVFAGLIHAGRLQVHELQGLSEEKLAEIRHIASC